MPLAKSKQEPPILVPLSVWRIWENAYAVAFVSRDIARNAAADIADSAVVELARMQTKASRRGPGSLFMGMTCMESERQLVELYLGSEARKEYLEIQASGK